MCGFAGFLDPGRSTAPARAETLLQGMAACIRRRGPDHKATWTDPEAGIALAHTRLAILDLSAAGHQPMASASGRFVTIYNGEIYNHLQIRAELEAAGAAPDWRGTSDTETLLAGIERWGLADTLRRATGMFALALWDREDRRLWLARDRIGEKPVYYGWQGQGAARRFLFGSEPAALAAHPSFEGDIDRRAVGSLLRHNYVPAPHAIYTGLHKLPPGCILALENGAGTPRIEPYWDFWEVTRARGGAGAGIASEAAAVDATEAVLEAAVRRQMISDVPLGAFLSGGIDSTCIAALMQKHASGPVKTFSIGFESEAFNEAEYARRVAEHLGTEHHELYVTEAEMLDVVPTLPAMYSEPFADSSQIPTSIVAGLARQQVTVALSGDAGDELFCGYTRYALTQGYWDRIAKVPLALRRAASGTLGALPQPGLALLARTSRGLLPKAMRFSDLPGKIEKAGRILPSQSALDVYRGLVSHVLDPGALLAEPAEHDTGYAGYDLEHLGSVERMIALDTVTYLPDDILVKVDRAAMYHSLETRAPFLDHSVVEFAWSLPFEYKWRGGQTKWALRRLVERHVPPALMERPKMGFGVPLADWLRGPLKDWGAALLDERRLAEEGIFAAGPVARLWREHQSGRRSHHALLWNVLMFQAWHETAARPAAAEPPAPARSMSLA